MADYTAKLKADLVEQFRDKPKIEDLIEVLGKQLQDVYDFYQQIASQLDVKTATGKQLDLEGDIIVLSRKEAGLLAGDPIPFDVVDDETYRLYLIFKILKNTGDGTYPNIIKGLRMFWDKPLYYSEDPNYPATMFFNTDWLVPGEDGNIDTLRNAPLLRAAGVGIHLEIRREVPGIEDTVYIGSTAGSVLETHLPEYRPDIPGANIYIQGMAASIRETRLPKPEEVTA